MLTAMLPAATAPIRHLTAPAIVSQQSTAPRLWVWSRSQQATAVVLGLLCMRSHSRPEQMPEGRRQRMLSRPKDSYSALTGRKDQRRRFLNSPSAPGMSRGRSAAASQIRAKLKCCRSWKEVIELVNCAKASGTLEASVLGAAMQVCGNNGWWEGLLELRRIQEEEGVATSRVLGSIALTALSHSLQCGRKGLVIADRVPHALEMGKAYWREVETARDPLTFNVVLSSALKLATRLDCQAAYKWGLEVWKTSERATFAKHHITLSTYICFLEQYQCCQEVDALLESPDEDLLQAINVVLLSSLMNCTALRRDVRRAEVLWEVFMKRHVEPNIICHAALAKVYLLAGRPAHVLKILDNRDMDLVGAMGQFPRVATLYAQALLVVCHSSLDLPAMKRLEEFLAIALDKDQKTPKQNREDLPKMRQMLKKLMSKPRQVYLRDVLIKWNARKQSVMAEWENFPGGSNYLEV